MNNPKPVGVTFDQVRRRPGLADAVANTLLRTILDRPLQPGDSLPSERELCEQLGVSRPVIREALRSLVAQGVIEMRPSASPVVTAVDPSFVSASMNLYLQTAAQDADRQVQEVRLVVEPAIAALAAVRATDDDIAALRAHYERVAAAVKAFRASPGKPGSDVVEEVLRADLEFHLGVARAAHNDVYLIMLEATRETQMVSRRVSVARPGALEREVERCGTELPPVLEAVLTRDSGRARDLMLAHIQDKPPA